MSGTLPRFADGKLDDVACALASGHARAKDYLSQAPVLAMLVPTRFEGVVTYGEVGRFSELVETGPSLRDVLRTAQAPLPLRKLRADALKLKMHGVIVALGALDNSTLSQVIPAEPERQFQWLCDLQEWCAGAAKRKIGVQHFRWAALALSRATGGVREVADFVSRGDRPLSERWTWAEAQAQVELWHVRLNRARATERLERRGGKPQKPVDLNEVICMGPWPNEALVEGVAFRSLRTRAALREEGQSMHHCVSSYASLVRQRKCGIISAKSQSGERATVEIVDGRVVQIKGVCNQKLSTEMRAAADTFALLHGSAVVPA